MGIFFLFIYYNICYLKEPRKDVKLKHRNVVVAGEIYGGFKSHRLHSLLECIHSLQLLLKTIPLYDTPGTTNACLVFRHDNTQTAFSNEQTPHEEEERKNKRKSTHLLPNEFFQKVSASDLDNL